MSAAAALLIVDDNEDNRYTLTRRLNREGYDNLTTANNGRKALDLLQSKPFDLVLLDIMMPDLNGYEVLEQMKISAELRNIPVIMISALSEIDSVIRCIELGAEDYLPKPFNPTLLRARVGATLEKNGYATRSGRVWRGWKMKWSWLADFSLACCRASSRPAQPNILSRCTARWNRHARSAAISMIVSMPQSACCIFGRRCIRRKVVGRHVHGAHA